MEIVRNLEWLKEARALPLEINVDDARRIVLTHRAGGDVESGFCLDHTSSNIAASK